jgi:hypothetical protein
MTELDRQCGLKEHFLIRKWANLRYGDPSVWRVRAFFDDGCVAYEVLLGTDFQKNLEAGLLAQRYPLVTSEPPIRRGLRRVADD